MHQLHDSVMGKTVRIAANRIVTEHSVVEPGVVVIDNGLAVAVEPLTEERESTLWMTGTITLKQDDEGHGLVAFHKGKLLVEVR